MSFPLQSSPHVPLSIDRLQTVWKRLADTYFTGRLPPIRIEWSNRLTASSGMFVSQVGPRSRRISQADRHGQARLIRLSAPLLSQQPESEIVRTLAHEMIHQWQYDVKKCRPTHGPEFKKIMDRMNRDGLGIAIRHSLHHQVDAFTKYTWQCVNCGESYRRQRRSISPKRHRCGSCQGALKEVSLGRTEECKDFRRPAKTLEKLRQETNTRQELIEGFHQLAFDF